MERIIILRIWNSMGQGLAETPLFDVYLALPLAYP